MLSRGVNPKNSATAENTRILYQFWRKRINMNNFQPQMKRGCEEIKHGWRALNTQKDVQERWPCHSPDVMRLEGNNLTGDRGLLKWYWHLAKEKRLGFWQNGQLDGKKGTANINMRAIVKKTKKRRSKRRSVVICVFRKYKHSVFISQSFKKSLEFDQDGQGQSLDTQNILRSSIQDLE